MVRAFLLVFLCTCGPRALDAPTIAEGPMEPRTVELREGETVVLAHRVQIGSLRHVMERQLEGNRAYVSCTVTVTTGDARQDVGFGRSYPGSPEFRAFADLELALDTVNAHDDTAIFVARERRR
jgi:hypothetical protein